jgi:hypothetical protein
MTRDRDQLERRPIDHEGATESTAPGEPREREVITPDWVALDDGTEVCEPATPAPPVSKKEPDRATPAQRDPPAKDRPVKEPPPDPQRDPNPTPRRG